MFDLQLVILQSHSRDPYKTPLPLPLLQWLINPNLDRLDAAVNYFCQKGIAETAHKTYQSALKRFASFVQHIHHFHLSLCRN